MKLSMFQKIVLKNGKQGHIVEIFKEGEAYMVDVQLSKGDYSGQEYVYPKYETVTITPEDIRGIIVEVEEPFALRA